MELSFSYDMHTGFSSPVTDHHYALLCLPGDTARQRVLSLTAQVQPGGARSSDVDFFGNRKLYGLVAAPHREFRVRVEGRVQTGLAPHEHYETQGLELFLAPSKYTVPGPALRALQAELLPQLPTSPYDRALFLLHALHRRFPYVPGSTHVHTTAEEALAGGGGVCQDYAHIFISLLRQNSIPARYVVGMLPGEGQSHAWAEANCRGYWYGLAPTNDCLADDTYIKISHGRDYRDCIVSRGVFRGRTQQTVTVAVRVSPSQTRQQEGLYP